MGSEGNGKGHPDPPEPGSTLHPRISFRDATRAGPGIVVGRRKDERFSIWQQNRFQI